MPADGSVHSYTVRATGGDEELRRVAAVRVTLNLFDNAVKYSTRRHCDVESESQERGAVHSK
jgi:hypothetical protein